MFLFLSVPGAKASREGGLGEDLGRAACVPGRKTSDHYSSVKAAMVPR